MTDEPLSIAGFLDEMEPDDFPFQRGPWRTFDYFDPPFGRRVLRSMAREGVIELDEPNKRFRLTMMATDARDIIASERAAAWDALAEGDTEEPAP